MKLQDIISAVHEYHPEADLELIRRAYAFVRKHHQGQTRASGEPYETHVTEVAYLASKLKLDVSSIGAALLHDTVEDTTVTLDDIRKEFGSDIADLVDGVTKLSKVNFSSRAEAQAENFRKMLLAMAQDIRVLLVKLCDRLHNMRTLEFLSESRRTRIAQETVDIYAPLANRLGIHWMKSELEDLSFRHLKPDVYEYVKRQVNKKKNERERYIKETCALISRQLEQSKIKGKVYGRPKHFFSIYQKMEKQGLHFDEIYDLIAFRIIVPSTMDCYAALGVVHATWKPIPGRFKDYIAMPKPNKYQSLHTTVIGPEGSRIEIQIRTPDMHDIAEKGIAAHWVYKEKGTAGGGRISPDALQFSWLKTLVENEKILHDPYEFMTLVKQDLFPEEVFVFSPRGDLFALAANATPIDFAYNIHTEVGQHCIGARVNGQQVPLSSRLQNGDTVEIITSPNQVPSKDWLKIVTTTKARQRIRSWLKAEERTSSIAVGRELLTKDLRKIKHSYSKLLKKGDFKRVAEDLGLKEVDMLLAEIGYGKLSTKAVIERLLPDTQDLDKKLLEEDSALQKIFQRAARAFGERSGGGIKVSGMNDVIFRYAKCCEPLPGDEVVGYVTRGRGVTIHKRGCAQTLGFDPRRLVPVSWDQTVKTQRRITIRVISLDQIGLLASMSQSISSCGANMVSVHAAAQPDGKAVNTFEIAVESTSQLDSIRRALEKIEGVLRVERVGL